MKLQNLEYNQKTPKFLQSIIAATGYQTDEQRVQDKFATGSDDEGRERPDADDEQPVIVNPDGTEYKGDDRADAPGKPHHERFGASKGTTDANETEEAPAFSAKPVFHKPAKHATDKGDELTVSSKRKESVVESPGAKRVRSEDNKSAEHDAEGNAKATAARPKSNKGDAKAKKANKKLLSFGDDEDA